MIVCVVDDLLFSIKISTAAKARGADVYFERSAANVLRTVSEKRPSLVIFDLNSQRMQPLQALTALKADPDLRRIRTLGYVSHVDGATIAAAREAGIDDVLARSAFADRLPEILAQT
jgi:PleD family two-component response regulator